MTVVNSPREIQNARMAVGVNGASIWWVNGKEAVDLFTDRRMKMDDWCPNGSRSTKAET